MEPIEFSDWDSLQSNIELPELESKSENNTNNKYLIFRCNFDVMTSDVMIFRVSQEMFFDKRQNSLNVLSVM